MRLILVLTVFAGLLAVVAFTGQTDSASTAQSVQSVQSVSTSIPAPKLVKCNGTKAYIVKKRNATWRWEDSIFVPRTRTSYANRRTACSPYLKWQARLWAGRADDRFRTYVSLREPEDAICHVFGIYCTEALAVSGCETGQTFDTKASNGQYLGLFQMGSFERSTYGHGKSALEQAVAALRYFVASGRDWSPWSCRWAAG